MAVAGRPSSGPSSGNHWLGQGLVTQSWSKAGFFCLDHSTANQSWLRLSFGPSMGQYQCAKLGCPVLGQARPRHSTLAVPTWLLTVLKLINVYVVVLSQNSSFHEIPRHFQKRQRLVKNI
ncbi:Protein of unknown function [Cotesia congregata]|uniref:Uncharacterized protein n=1 Tax=Cotesia congregata TaxID=51543 RepID=A0A8J2HTD6_COTCN|nr:Protein of unknown function [Cotesia congregata]